MFLPASLVALHTGYTLKPTGSLNAVTTVARWEKYWAGMGYASTDREESIARAVLGTNWLETEVAARQATEDEALERDRALTAAAIKASQICRLTTGAGTADAFARRSIVRWSSRLRTRPTRRNKESTSCATMQDTSTKSFSNSRVSTSSSPSRVNRVGGSQDAISRLTTSKPRPPRDL